MNWRNVKLIHLREVRDQLRDRRTMFMIAVLPIFLYPLLGMSFFQIAQFRHEKPTSVIVVGSRPADGVPLLEGHSFSARLMDDPADTQLFDVHFFDEEFRDDPQAAADPLAAARNAVQEGRYDAVLHFPADFSERLAAVRRAVAERRPAAAQPERPEAQIFYTKAREKSYLAYLRLKDKIAPRWIELCGEKNLTAGGLPSIAARPLTVEAVDLADKAGRGTIGWSKILPVLLLIWALTGAFYPAIDLCAGEKERGTLETLLCSPAERSEIVLGKLLTIMGFSIVTAGLNLASMGVTGWLILGRMQDFGPPPPWSVLWLALALVPVAALFSALALAMAAFARGTKEGQYYLMPLLLVTMPLAILPATPGVELTLGNSLVPVTGMVLLLKTLLEGNYWLAVQFAAPVMAVTLALAALAVRWAVDQFNSEAVLFRESERLDVGLWLRGLRRDLQPTPSVAMAVFCGAVILLVRFFLGIALGEVHDFRHLALQATVVQLAAILAPALVLALLLTDSPRQTLLLRLPQGRGAALIAPLAAALLALALHPLVLGLQTVVMRLYPIDEKTKAALAGAMGGTAPFWATLLVLAALPAVCEELAFRGFILSGLRHLGHKWRAVVYTALLFGVAHFLLQQSLVACLVGVVIGVLAVQTNSLLPCVVFHVCHNSLALLRSRLPELVDRWPSLRCIVAGCGEEQYPYHWFVPVAGALVAAALLAGFLRRPAPQSREEEIQDAIDRGARGQVW